MLRRLIRSRPVLPIAAIATVAAVAIGSATGHQTLSTTGFWATVYIEANEAEHYDSLRAMRDSADAVLLGKITTISPGRVFAYPPDDVVQYVTAAVQVDRVLSGNARTDASGQVLLEVMLPNTTLLDAVVAASPSSQSVFFLRYKATEAAALGFPAEVVAAEEPFYRLVTLRAVVWNEAGRAAVHPGDHPDFLTALGGRPFEEVIRSATR